MLRFLVAPVACATASLAASLAAGLILVGSATAQDRPGPAGPTLPEIARPAATADAPAPLAEPAPLDSLALRRPEPEAAQTTSALRSPPAAPKPWCAQERRVGTGAGFCLIN